MSTAGDRHFFLPFCCRLDKKEGVWRYANRRFQVEAGGDRPGQVIGEGEHDHGREGALKQPLLLGGEEAESVLIQVA